INQTNRVGVAQTAAYDANGLTTTASYVDSDGANRTTTTVIDLLGRTVRYTDEQGTLTRSTYHQTGRPLETYRTLPGGTETLLATAEVDTAGRPWQTSDHVSGTARTTTVSYEAATGRPVTTTLPNGVVTTLGYDTNRGWATTSAWARNSVPIASTWVQAKNIAGRTTNDSAGGVINRSYAHDNANRLTTVTDGAITRLYAYDRNTNRCGLAATCDGQWTVDQADRLQASPQASAYTYDWRGNLTASTPRPGKTSATQILYDGWDHARVLNDGTTTATSTLDPTGRVLRRKVTRISDSVVLEDTTYGYSGPGDTPAWHRPTTGTTYTSHLGGGATDTNGVPTWQLVNPHGDIIGATDANGTFTFQPHADEFGNGPVNSDRNGWLGIHERSVDHTGLGWYRMGVRLYDPTTSRFQTVDPIEGGSCNDYEYVCADSIGSIDLSGTHAIICKTKAYPVEIIQFGQAYLYASGSVSCSDRPDILSLSVTIQRREGRGRWVTVTRCSSEGSGSLGEQDIFLGCSAAPLSGFHEYRTKVTSRKFHGRFSSKNAYQSGRNPPLRWVG
ncbi:MAG: RHS repeat-associated core domain-containing protein, partial [Acidimicrobiales bacterium]